MTDAQIEAYRMMIGGALAGVVIFFVFAVCLFAWAWWGERQRRGN